MTPKPSAQQIERWVQKAQNGDQKSFEKLFEVFFDKIFRYVRFRVDDADAEDIVSDIFLKVVENLNAYHPQKKAGFNAWIFRIAHNNVIDFYRKKKELLGLSEDEGDDIFLQIPDEKPTPEEKADQKLTFQKLTKILRHLPSVQRDILELKYLEGMTNAEISEITGKSEGNIRVIQLRALREIRKNWND